MSPSETTRIAQPKQSNQCKTESRHNQSLGEERAGGVRDDALQSGKCRNIGFSIQLV